MSFRDYLRGLAGRLAERLMYPQRPAEHDIELLDTALLAAYEQGLSVAREEKTDPQSEALRRRPDQEPR